jgi:hypothetical protein
MSALPPKADMGTQPRDVRFVPKAYIFIVYCRLWFACMLALRFQALAILGLVAYQNSRLS